MTTFNKIAAFMRKDFINDTSYTLSFVARWIGILLAVFTFFYLSRLVGGKGEVYLEYYGADYFSFVLVGLAVMSFLNSAINGFPATVEREQSQGTLEMLISTPTKLPILISAFSSYNILMGFIAFALYLFLGILLGVNLYAGNIFAVFVIITLSTISFLSLGIMAASVSVMFKRGDPVRWIITNLFWLLGGVYFPVAVLPDVLRKISFFIPSTYALRAVRLALLRGYSLSMLGEDIFVLLVFACLLSVTSYIAFVNALNFAKRRGTIALS